MSISYFPVIDVPECPTGAEAGLQNSVLTLLTIACKHDTEEKELRSFLTQLNLQTTSIEDLLEIYSQSREDIQKRLAKYGHDIPWVSNVNWRLSSVIRSSGRESLQGELVYKVAFETTDQTGGRSTITTFDCTIEELQNLSAKFKEIERNCIKIAENK